MNPSTSFGHKTLHTQHPGWMFLLFPTGVGIGTFHCFPSPSFLPWITHCWDLSTPLSAILLGSARVSSICSLRFWWYRQIILLKNYRTLQDVSAKVQTNPLFLLNQYSYRVSTAVCCEHNSYISHPALDTCHDNLYIIDLIPDTTYMN